MNRVWVYQANRFLTSEEVDLIARDMNEFVQSWTAHGSALAGKSMVKEALFLIFEVDETQASLTGCAIDKSVHFLKALGQKYSIDFFDRLKISIRSEKDGLVKLLNRDEFETLFRAGEISSDTLVFNNLIQNSLELENHWEIPFSQSWHSKVFK